MRIQVILYSTSAAMEKDGIDYSPMRAPNAIDDYDIDIIDLSVDSMWKYKDEVSIGLIDSFEDLATIQQMINNKKKAIVVYVLPQNIIYSYNTRYNKTKRKPLKDVIDAISKYSLTKVLPTYSLKVNPVYEKTGTLISGKKYNADFYLLNSNKVITKSEKSEKPTTIEISKNIYVTTLAITKSIDDLKHFVSSLFENHEHTEAPEWAQSIVFGDDVAQKATIAECNAEIQMAQRSILAAEEKLKENAEFKSILYTNGDELVSTVFKILEHIFDYDLSDFHDDKREDFLIRLPDQTFIGEIKGVTSNVKYEHITQVELHYRGYLDRLAETGTSEAVKQLLIINPFRTKPLEQREPVHTAQIELATRNNCLIIETQTLLNIYEKFCSGKLSTQTCIKVFAEKIGLLKLSDFEDN